MKKVAIVQSNYIPWKGYFDLIASVDEFILFDDMQYTRRDWRNRNQIKTPKGLQWLTVSVKVKGKYFQTIRETELNGITWAGKHWKTLEQYYIRTPYFEEVSSWLKPLYNISELTHLSSVNRMFLEAICKYLGISTFISFSWDYAQEEGKSERLAGLCQSANGDIYVSGPSAQKYLDEKVFHDRGLKLEWFNYNGYPTYPQMWGKFEHSVSILDLLFNCGPTSRKYLKHV